MISKQDTKRQFGRTAEAYLKSSTHAKDIDLDVLLLLLQPKEVMTVLDIATGAGHTAMKVAPHVKEVVATDLTEEMLERVREQQKNRGITNVRTMLADAEELPFEDGAFDAVTCRLAPHHFLDVQKAVNEIARVLKPRGTFILEDGTTPLDPELDRFLDTVERLRDRTHIRAYSLPEWYAFAANAHLVVEETLIYRKKHGIEEWLDTAGISSEDREAVLDLFRKASPRARLHYQLTYDQEAKPQSYTDDKIIMRMRRV